MLIISYLTFKNFIHLNLHKDVIVSYNNEVDEFRDFHDNEDMVHGHLGCDAMKS
jgi:hypothetical protein